MPRPHRREQPEATRKHFSGLCSVRYVHHITSRANIGSLAERFGARRRRHPATASTHST